MRRFYQRFFTGVAVGGRLRILCLTSSDEATSRELDIHRGWRALLKRLRRLWGRFEYMGVVEHEGDRKHLHLVFRGDYMEQALLSALWGEIHLSPVVDIRVVWGARGGARYLAKYLVKERLNRYWASYGWVFRGWVGWSQRVKKAIGRFPARNFLVVLARLSTERRAWAMEALGP